MVQYQTPVSANQEGDFRSGETSRDETPTRYARINCWKRELKVSKKHLAKTRTEKKKKKLTRFPKEKSDPAYTASSLPSLLSQAYNASVSIIHNLAEKTQRKREERTNHKATESNVPGPYTTFPLREAYPSLHQTRETRVWTRA